MLNRQEIIEILKKELPYLNENYYVKRIGLFGSYAKGSYTDVSDIDLIVEFDKSIGLKFMSLVEYFENLFGKKVDVLTPEGIRSIRVKRVAEDITREIIYV
jgi:hypothetical protein